MDFSRQQGEGNASQRWIGTNLPICPLCKAESLWETSTEVDQLALGRWHFRCSNCTAVFSTPPDITVATPVPRVNVMGKTVAKNLRIESAGRNNNVQGMVGKEYPLAELQEWARPGAE